MAIDKIIWGTLEMWVNPALRGLGIGLKLAEAQKSLALSERPYKRGSTGFNNKLPCTSPVFKSWLWGGRQSRRGKGQHSLASEFIDENMVSRAETYMEAGTITPSPLKPVSQ